MNWLIELFGVGKIEAEPNWIIRAGTPVSVPMKNGVMSPKFPLPVDFDAKLVSTNDMYNVYMLDKTGELAYVEPQDE